MESAQHAWGDVGNGACSRIERGKKVGRKGGRLKAYGWLCIVPKYGPMATGHRGGLPFDALCYWCETLASIELAHPVHTSNLERTAQTTEHTETSMQLVLETTPKGRAPKPGTGTCLALCAASWTGSTPRIEPRPSLNPADQTQPPETLPRNVGHGMEFINRLQEREFVWVHILEDRPWA